MSDRDAFRAEPGDDLKKPDEWCKLLGYEVMDPDGWRGSNGRPWTDPISQAEFEARIVTCTLRRVDPRSTFRAAQQERRLHGLKARHETREARAVRKATAEEIAQALEEFAAEVYPEDFFPPDGTSVDCHSARVMRVAYPNAARIAREIGSRDPE